MSTAAQSPSSVRPLADCLAQIERSILFRNALMDATHPSDSGHGPINPHLTAPLRDAVGLFTALRIPYSLAGSMAAMMYGRPRFTEHVDFIAATGHQEILAQHPETMKQFHFDPACTWKLYHASGLEIDLWKDEFANEIAARARSFPLHDREVKVAEVHDLIAMKLRAGRIQDDYDVSEILKRTPIDEGALRSLVTSGQFSHFIHIKSRTQR